MKHGRARVMVHNLKLLITLLAPALLGAAVAFAATPPAGAQKPDAPARPAGLTPQEKRGKVIYTRGESPSGRENLDQSAVNFLGYEEE